MNKQLFFCSIIIFSLPTHAMIVPHQSPAPSDKQLNFFSQQKITFNNGLPEEINTSILNNSLTPFDTIDLYIIAQTVSSLIQTNKQLYTIINDSTNHLNLIKQLARSCNCSDESIANILQTKEGMQRYLIQNTLKSLCKAQIWNEIDNNFPKLLKLNVDLDFTYRNDDLTIVTPLMMAYDYPIFNRLIEKGANCNYITSTGLSFALFAAKHASGDCFNQNKNKYINRINLNQQDKKGNTPLLIAIQTRNQTMVKDLLDAGADPELANNDGITPLVGAEIQKDTNIINMIYMTITNNFLNFYMKSVLNLSHISPAQNKKPYRDHQ